MPSLAKLMQSIDEKIFARLGESLVIGSDLFGGVFSSQYTEFQFQDGIAVGLNISFATQYNDAIGALAEGDELQILGDGVEIGRYVFMRRVPDRGDESGRVVLELGSL